MYEANNNRSKLISFDYGLRSRLLLLLAVMLLPFIAFSAYQAYSSYDKRTEMILSENERDARETAGNVDELVQSTIDLLVATSQSQAATEQNFPELKRWFNEISTKYPYYKNIIYVDLDGNIRAAARNYTKPDGEVIANVSDTVYYQRSLKAEGVAYGNFMYGYLSRRPVIHITHPVFSKDNKVGFIAVAFDLKRLQERIVTTNVTEGTEISVFDQNGTVIARTLDPDRWVGKCLKTSDIFSKGQDGTKHIKAPGPDGIVRVMSFHKTSKAPWLVTVCFEDAAIRNQSLSELFKQLALFVPLLLVAIFGWLWIGRDVDGLYKAARHLSLLDPVTSLGSYQKFNQDLHKDIARAKHQMQSLSMLILDIDGFQRFNEENGYHYSNRALVQVADIVRDNLRDTDFAYRHGGDEISLLLTDTDELDATEFAARVKTKVSESTFATKDGSLVGLTISVGIATYPVDASSADYLVECASEALFIAKGTGNSIATYSQTQRPRKVKEGSG